MGIHTIHFIVDQTSTVRYTHKHHTMSQTQTIQQAPAVKLNDRELQKLFSVDAQKQGKITTSAKSETKSTLDSLLFPERRPRKFDNNGKRNAEWDSKLKQMTVGGVFCNKEP